MSRRPRAGRALREERRSPHLAAVIGSLLSLAAASGCQQSETETVAPAPPDACAARHDCRPGDLLSGCGNCLSADATFDLDACTRGLLPQDIDATLALSADFIEALKVLDDADVLADRLAADFRNVLLSLASKPEADLLRAPFSLDDKGTYRAQLASFGASTVAARFLFADGYQNAKADDVIVPSVFRAESYLPGAQIQTSGLSATVTFAEVGPLVELLGFGPSPTSPIVLDLEGSQKETQRQTLEYDVLVDESGRSGGVVRMAVRVRRLVLGNLGGLGGQVEIGEQDVTSKLVSSEITNAALGQTATLISWSRNVHVDGGPLETGEPIEGTALLSVTGGSFPYTVRLDWKPRKTPRARFECAQ